MADQQDAQRQVTARWAEIDALAKQLQGTIRTGFGKNTMVFHTKAARQLGIPLPEDSHVRADGRVGKNTNDIKFALMAAGAMATPFIAPAIAGALGGGAAGGGTAASGGTAAGGTAAGGTAAGGTVAGGTAAGSTAAYVPTTQAVFHSGVTAPLATGSASALPMGATAALGAAPLLPSRTTTSPVGRTEPGWPPDYSTAPGSSTPSTPDSSRTPLPGKPSSFWNTVKKIAEIAVPAGATIYGAKKIADANTEAARIEQENFDKALALEKEMYERRRADLTPYRIAGQGAAATLSNLMGIAQPNMGTVSARPPAGTPAAQEIPVPPSTTPAPTVPGQAVPRGNLTPPGTSSGATRMRAPDGTVRLIPPDQVQQALANGGQMVSA